MITFSKLGNYGRLGNQLFQYAYLRSMAQKLNTNFWCPEWEGDRMFELEDESVRVRIPPDKFGNLFDQGAQAGFSKDALNVTDGVDVQGYFQSERYYKSRDLVKTWYRFKTDIKNGASEKFDVSLAGESVSISLRLDSDYAKTREFFPLYPPKFYSEALEKINGAKRVLVFADRIDLARNYVEKVSARLPFVFVKKLSPAEQLWLMTQCRCGNILTNSTFSWWGGYLNENKNAPVIVPTEWVRPGVTVPIVDILPDDWIKIKALRPILDNFKVWRLTHPVETIGRVIKKFRLN